MLDVHLHVGPRFETESNNGLSHFLEHMLFRGTRTLPSAHQQALAFESLGGSLEAMTYTDHGSMTLTAPPANLAALAPAFAEVFERPLLGDVEVERSIVEEEINEDLDEHGEQIDPANLVRALAFDGHPLGLPITGMPAQLASFDKARLRRHHRRHYTAASSVVTIVTPERPDELVRQLEAGFAGLAAGKEPRSRRPKPQRGTRFRYTRHASSQTSLRLAFRAPGALDPMEPATQLVLRLLDDGMSTRLYARICDELGLCYDVAAEYEAYRDVGIIDISAETEHRKTERVFAEMLHVVGRLRDEGPRPGELDRAKARHGWQLDELLDSPRDVADFHAVGLLLERGATLSERRAALAAVTEEEVRDAAERIFRPEHASLAVVGSLPVRTLRRLENQVSGF